MYIYISLWIKLFKIIYPIFKILTNRNTTLKSRKKFYQTEIANACRFHILYSKQIYRYVEHALI